MIDCPVANAENLHETICCFGQGASVFLADGRYAVELQFTFALQRVIGKGLFQRALVTVPVVVHALPGDFAVQLKGADRNARADDAAARRRRLDGYHPRVEINLPGVGIVKVKVYRVVGCLERAGGLLRLIFCAGGCRQQCADCQQQKRCSFHHYRSTNPFFCHSPDAS